MTDDIARVISRVLASEQRAREAEARAEKAEKEARQFKWDVEVLEIQLGEAQELASQAICLCEEITTSGSYLRDEGHVCRNGERGRTLIPNQIRNLMVEIIRIDEDTSEAEQDESEEEEDEEEEAEDTDPAWAMEHHGVAG